MSLLPLWNLTATHVKYKSDRKMSDIKDVQFIYNRVKSSEEILF